MSSPIIGFVIPRIEVGFKHEKPCIEIDSLDPRLQMLNNFDRHTTRQILLHSSTSNNYWQLGPNLNGGAYAYRKRSNVSCSSQRKTSLSPNSKVLDELCPHTFDDKWLWWNNALFTWDSVPNLTIETDFDPGMKLVNPESDA